MRHIGTGSMHFTTKEKADGSLRVQATFGGILDLLAGGRAHLHAAGNIVFDASGNLTVHEDHFTLKPIGKYGTVAVAMTLARCGSPLYY